MKLAITLAALALVVAHVSSLVRHDHIGALNVGLVQRSEKLHAHAFLSSAVTYEDLYFDQKLDHFDNTNKATWKQRYMVNATYWKPGGPIFFVLGGEGPISPAYIKDHFITGPYSQHFGALVIALEHRFYGKSVPMDGDEPHNLRFLSSQQALADASNFRDFIADKYEADTSKWIIFGGSYSGCLSAWLKSKYSHQFDGSYATSAPVRAELDFGEYLEVVSHSVGPSCSAKIHKATQMLEKMMESPEGKAKIIKTFNVCSPFKDEKDIATFFESIVDPIAGVVQYNNDNNNYQVINIPQMCELFEKADCPVKAWAQLLNKVNGQPTGNASCFDASYKSFLQSMQSTSAGRSWTWQTCTEFGFFQTASGKKQPFSKYVTLGYFVDMCYDIFGEDLVPDTDWTNRFYGSVDIKTSNTFMPNGNVDPWHALGALGKDIGPSSATVLIDGTAHCADLYVARQDDVPSLKQARKLGFSLMQEWLA